MGSSPAKYLGLVEVLQELLGSREGGYLYTRSPDLPGEMGIAPCGHGDAGPSGYLFRPLVIGSITDASFETLDDLYPIYDRLRPRVLCSWAHPEPEGEWCRPALLAL